MKRTTDPTAWPDSYLDFILRMDCPIVRTEPLKLLMGRDCRRPARRLARLVRISALHVPRSDGTLWRDLLWNPATNPDYVTDRAFDLSLELE